MVLSDKDIKKAIKAKEIIIKPLDVNDIQPASVDLHLDRHFLVFDSEQHFLIDPKKKTDDMMKKVSINAGKPLVIHPGRFVLGMIQEMTGVSDRYLGRLEGKSSVGRMGLLIHVTAGILDPGNCLKMTLELHNVADLPIMLYYKMPIAQMVFEELSSPCENPYSKKKGHKYCGDLKPRASQMWKNF